MGADPYFYVVDHDTDVQGALDRSREREFRAGRYRPAVDWPQDYLTDVEPKPGPGAQHESIEAVFEEAAADGDPSGTASILDLWTVGDRPALMTASRVADGDLRRYFGTLRPTAEQVNASEDFWADIDRGTGRYVVAYLGDTPTGLCFAGYSID